ncbi:D-cysteine desulfhydrase 2, mitochondrial isoform X4 [Cryptomeria japonica]|uniref:D-cysteine desulfhydrase 2, mitochondrial isoform X4 n=1 Tax=Cryptomeria japonica TaxID=3369 RepID=UPI0027D9E8B0|nr:D-cysteine desulfhydrase 2, mitochondrial isoform X4 [Cryptomeria japonica]
MSIQRSRCSMSSISAFLRPTSLSFHTSNAMGRPYDERGLSRILDRRWLLSSPQVKIHEVLLSNAKEAGGTCANLFSFSSNLHPALGEKLKESRQRRNSFYVIRDDLLHPLISGNKTRKLDALLPLIEAHSVTDVVTCGGCQSAHAAALAVACAERGIQAHLLLRGEQPEIPTGYNLISEMYGHVIYVPRSVYANREALLARHASLIAGDDGSIMWLHDEVKMSPMPVENYASHQHGSKVHMSCIATCTSTRKVAVVKEGGGDAVALLGLIRLVDYLSQPSLFGRDQTVQIVVDSGTGTTAVGLALGALLLGFGRVFKGELELCREIAQRTGILLDPVYTLSSWEHASLTCQKCINSNDIVVMLHTGGTLGLFGLAQRYKSFFPLSQENIAKPALCV